MNLESHQPKSNKIMPQDEINLEDFDFKPITSGLGFHHPKIQDVKPVFTEKNIPVSNFKNTNPTIPSQRVDVPVYENDLSLFYKNPPMAKEFQSEKEEPSIPESKTKHEPVFQLATKGSRFFAYFFDLGLVLSLLALTLVVMTRIIEMDLISVWRQYPNEITPLVCILFCGFYLLYFSIFEKSYTSTFGKNLFSLRVLNFDNTTPGIVLLAFRTSISLINFLTLGLFSWFDLQGKMTQTKIVRIK